MSGVKRFQWSSRDSEGLQILIEISENGGDLAPLTWRFSDALPPRLRYEPPDVEKNLDVARRNAQRWARAGVGGPKYR
jgi:hypothetical protein